MAVGPVSVEAVSVVVVADPGSVSVRAVVVRLSVAVAQASMEVFAVVHVQG